MRPRVMVSLLLAGGSWPLAAQEVRPAIPVNPPEIRRAEPVNPIATAAPSEPPTAPAVPFSTPIPAPPSTPSATPSPTPVPTPRPSPTPLPIPSIAPGTPTPASAMPATADQQQLDYADGLFVRKTYDLAAAEYQRYLTQYPDAPGRESALFRLAECQRLLGNTNAARTGYDALLGSYVTGEFVGPAAYRLGEIYFQAQDYQNAQPLFRKASLQLTDRAVINSARYFQARCLEKTGAPIEARSIYQMLAETSADNPFREASRLAVAQIFAASGRRADALEQYLQLAKETAHGDIKAEALVKAGLLQVDLKQPDNAALSLKAALALPEIGVWKSVAEVGLLRVLYASGQYQQLAATYKDHAADYTGATRPEVMLLAANSERQLHHYDAALDLYGQVMKGYPDSTVRLDAQYERLVTLYTADKSETLAEADAFLATNPEPEKRDRILLLKAETLYKKKQYADAAPVYAQIGKTGLAPELKADAQFKLGWCYMQSNGPALAIDAFTTFIQSYPGNRLIGSAFAQRAIAYQQTKKYPEALKDFSTVIANYPKAAEREVALQQKGLILGEEQDNAGMAATFKQLLSEYPKTSAAAQANYWIGWAAYEAKDYQQAIAPLQKACKLDAEQYFERAALRIMLAQYYLGQRDELAKQVDDYIKSKGQTKVPPEILRWLGQQYYAANNFPAAAKALALLAERPEERQADDALMLARAYVQQKKFAEAEAALQLYLAAATGSYAKASGLVELGQAQLGQGKYGDAQKTADQICTLQPEGRLNAQGRTLAGEIALAQAQFEEAAKIFTSVTLVFDDPAITPQAMEKAVLSYRKAGNDAEADKMLNKLKSRFPEYKPALATAAASN